MDNSFDFSKSGEGMTIQINTKRFDATNASQFKTALESNCPDGENEIKVDLSEIEFIDSSGIGALLSIQKRLKDNAQPIILVNPKPSVLSIIELLRLHRVFRLQKN